MRKVFHRSERWRENLPEGIKNQDWYTNYTSDDEADPVYNILARANNLGIMSRMNSPVKKRKTRGRRGTRLKVPMEVEIKIGGIAKRFGSGDLGKKSYYPKVLKKLRRSSSF